MAINTTLLRSAAMLQDYLVDNVTGLPLENGVITCYQDSSRTVLKNWYYQTGTPGNYSWLPLDNPMTLSSVGTMVDPSGHDIIPFFYPFDELDETVKQVYYITVDNQNGQRQFTRANFPFIPDIQTVTSGPTLNNLIANNDFYNCDVINSNIDLTNVTNGIIAPSQHDGLYASSSTDHRFVKDSTGATDTLKFVPFAAGTTPFYPQQTPNYYLSMTCSAFKLGQTRKALQLPICRYLKTLEGQTATVSFWAQHVSGTNTIDLSIQQFSGSGGTSTYTPIKTYSLTTSWIQYVFTFVIPAVDGIAVTSTGDDALFLNINFPLTSNFSVNLTKPALYLGNEVPNNDFRTFDQIDSITMLPRTGDVRIGLNAFSPWGWVPMNDGTIGNGALVAPIGLSITRNNVDTWNLFYLLWNSVGSTYAPMYEENGIAVIGYGASAYADWVAKRQIALTKQLGRAIASVGLANIGGVTNYALGQIDGTQQHTLALGEIPNHTHDAPPGFTFRTNQNTLNFSAPAGAVTLGDSATTGTVTSYPVQSAFNITQPTAFYNVFMKL